MLAIGRLRAGGERYYLSTVRAGCDADCRLVEPDGRWLGRSVRQLEADGVGVTPASLGSLLRGIDPRSGEMLDDHHDRVRVVAFDCMFAAPKPVSILHALAGSQTAAEVQAAHDSSVGATLGYLERHSAAVRRRLRAGSNRQVVLRAASGLGAAAFLHRSSRSGDPHLHTHLLVANLAAGEDGRWSALDGRGLYLHATAASALYGAHLRAELRERLGLCFDPLGSGDLAAFAGIDRRVVAAFSRRSSAIAEELALAGSSGRRAASIAAARTRPAKDLSLSYEELLEQWRARAVSLGLSWRRLDEVVARPPLLERDAPRAARAGAGERIELPLGGLSRRDLLVATCRSLPGGARVEDAERLADALACSGRVERAGTARPRLGGGRSARSPASRRAPATPARAGSLPAGVAEARYLTPETLELMRSWQRLIDAAGKRAGVELLALPPGTDLADPAAAGAVAALAGRHAEAGKALLAVLGGGWLRSACLEALSGLEAVPARAAVAGSRETAWLVEPDLVEHAPRLAKRLLQDVAGARRAVVVAVAAGLSGRGGPGVPGAQGGALATGCEDLLAPETAHRARRAPLANSGAPVPHDVAGVEVLTATAPGALLDALARDALAAAPGAAGALVVVGRRQHAEALQRALGPGVPVPAGLQVVTAGELGSTPARGGGRHLFVLGSAALLAGSFGRRRVLADGMPESVRRVHYAVLPAAMAPVERRGRLLELARPLAVLEAIGPPPPAGAARARWRAAALEWERAANQQGPLPEVAALGPRPPTTRSPERLSRTRRASGRAVEAGIDR